jgi:hypothetical protein
VSSGPGEDASFAAEAVLAVSPPDDAGAETADRYEWQATMAAADGLALYFDAMQDGQLAGADNTRIVCEHHEDWVVVRADYAELVSAKHRETAYGVFSTIRQLLDDGGLAHLFERWHAMRELPGCRLVTTAGLAPGRAQELESAAGALRALRDAGQMLLIGGEHDKIVAQFAEALQKHARDKLPASWQSAMEVGETTPTAAQRDQVGRFLSVLSIDHGKPSRAYATHAAPTLYCEPVLRLLGKDAAYAVPVWEAVLSLFRVRMRAAGPTRRGGLPVLLACEPGVLSEAVLNDRAVGGRIVTLGDIGTAVRNGLANRRGYLPVPPIPRVTRIGAKMERGLCADTSIERAELLRRDYQQYWRDRGSGDPLAGLTEARVRRVLHRISDEATDAVARPQGEPWGADLWRELQARTDALPAGEWPGDLDADLRLGGACDLVAQCMVWFSERFDVDAHIAAVRAELGT